MGCGHTHHAQEGAAWLGATQPPPNSAPQVLARKGLTVIKGSDGVMWACAWPLLKRVPHPFCPHILSFKGDGSGRKGQQHSVPQLDRGTLGGTASSSTLRFGDSALPHWALAAPLALALWGRRGAASCCQADPEIAVTFCTQLGSTQDREAYVRLAESSQGGGAGYFGRGLPRPGHSSFPQLPQAPLTWVRQDLGQWPLLPL